MISKNPQAVPSNQREIRYESYHFQKSRLKSLLNGGIETRVDKFLLTNLFHFLPQTYQSHVDEDHSCSCLLCRVRKRLPVPQRTGRTTWQEVCRYARREFFLLEFSCLRVLGILFTNYAFVSPFNPGCFYFSCPLLAAELSRSLKLNLSIESSMGSSDSTRSVILLTDILPPPSPLPPSHTAESPCKV